MGETPAKMADVSGNKEDFVREIFGGIARRYDLVNSVMSLGLDRYWRNSVIKSLGDIRDCRGLDVCCGTGKLTRLLARAVGSEGGVVGLDFSEAMLSIARSRCGQNTVTFVSGNALSLPFPDASFDFVTVAWGLRNVQNISQALAEMTRVVKKGGRVISLDMAEPPNPLLRGAYWALFSEAIPTLGRLLAKNRSAYRYLFESVLAFPKQEALSRMFSEAGLADVSYQNLSWGVVAIVKGTKNR